MAEEGTEAYGSAQDGWRKEKEMYDLEVIVEMNDAQVTRERERQLEAARALYRSARPKASDEEIQH